MLDIKSHEFHFFLIEILHHSIVLDIREIHSDELYYSDMYSIFRIVFPLEYLYLYFKQISDIIVIF